MRNDRGKSAEAWYSPMAPLRIDATHPHTTPPAWRLCVAPRNDPCAAALEQSEVATLVAAGEANGTDRELARPNPPHQDPRGRFHMRQVAFARMLALRLCHRGDGCASHDTGVRPRRPLPLRAPPPSRSRTSTQTLALPRPSPVSRSPAKTARSTVRWKPI